MLTFTKESIEGAIAKIEEKPELRKRRESEVYDLIFEGKTYPPILVLSEAHKLLGGEELQLIDFGNSTKTAFSKLEGLGFTVERKNNYSISDKIKEFSKFYKLEVIKKHSRELNSFNILVNQLPEMLKNVVSKQGDNFILKGSIGAGVNTYYPWLGIFDKRVSSGATNGFYVVLLFSNDFNDIYLTLNQGSTISTKEQVEKYRDFVFSINDNLDGFEKGRIPEGGIEKMEVLSTSNLGKKYEETNIFYKKFVVDELDETEFLSYLVRIVNFYKKCVDAYKGNNNIAEFDFKAFYENAKRVGLKYSEQLICRFVSSLCTKPFVILTGLSGSGKTKLAQAFAMWICEDEDQYCIVPVGADWTNREPLLGFPNALLKEDYKLDDFGVLKLILNANKYQDKPFFLILDEMNLSHVERYFADFLSVMESKTEITLHSGDGEWTGVPSKISFPKNLFIIGTVNIDETTYMFSPKVLDRANVIEFRVTSDEMEEYLLSYGLVKLENLKGLGKNMAQDFVAFAKDTPLTTDSAEEINITMLSFFSELKKSGAEFGYRSAAEILRFASVAHKLETTWSAAEIIDAAIMQKLLPKVHGSRRKLEPVLKTLGSLCLKDSREIEILISKNEIVKEDKEKIKYPVSFEKILRMYQNLLSNGFTSYAEA